MSDLNFLLIASVKDEGAILWEWVAHHLLCGFTDIVIFQNDSTDGTVETLETLHDAGFIRYENNTSKYLRETRFWKAHAHRKVTKFKEYLAADYVLVLDADEFLCLNDPCTNLSDLVTTLPDVPEIRLNWKLFGSNAQTQLSPQLVTERFTRTENPNRICGSLTEFKTLFKPQGFDQPAIHRPRPFSKEDAPQTNGSGLLRDEFDLGRYRSTDPAGQIFAQINHYMLRDVESFLLKLARGRPGKRSFKPYNYWRQRDVNSHEDKGLYRKTDALKAKMELMDRATNGTLSRLQVEAIEYQRAQVAELMKDPIYRRIQAFCLGKDEPHQRGYQLPYE